MPCQNSQEWIAAGEALIAAAQLSGPALTQATLALRLANPYEPDTAKLYGGPVNTDYPYFVTGGDGCPQMVTPATGNLTVDPINKTVLTPPLRSPSPPTPPTTSSELVVPPASPPATSAPTASPTTEPCPPGFVSSGTPAVPAVDLTAEVQRQLIAVGASSAIEAGGCNPTIMLAPQQMVTKDDFLVVSASSIYLGAGGNPHVVPLTVTARLLGCDGKIQNMQSKIDLSHTRDAGAVQGRICFALTDGYLVSVVASGAPYCTQPGEVWVQGEVRNQSCTGTPVIPLFSGYMDDQSYVAWPGGPQTEWGQGKGALHGTSMGTSFTPEPSWIPEAGTKVRIRQVVLDYSTGATVAARTPLLYWAPNAPVPNMYISTTQSQPASTRYNWLWANGLQGGLMTGYIESGGGSLYDAIVHVPFPPDLIGDGDAQLTMWINNAKSAEDTINGSGVVYEVWAEPADTGF